MHRSNTGFTLVELLVCLVIVSVLAGFAVFSAPDWIAQYQARTSLSTLRTAINLARHAAVRRGYHVVICPSAGATCGDDNTWHNGTLTFEDRDRDLQYGASDVVVSQAPGITSGEIVWRSFRNRGVLLFKPRGLTDWQNGHFQFCPEDGDARHARQIILNHAGRTYASRDRDGDGIHEDARGRPLQCS